MKSSSSSSSAPVAHAEIDPSSASILLPIDRYQLSPEEHDDIVSARSVAMIDCVEAAGFATSEQKKRLIPDNNTSRRYGVWLMAEAERFGYVVPESKAKKEALARNSGPSSVSQAELDQRTKCGKDSAAVKALSLDELEGGPWSSELTAAGDAVRTSPAWVEVVGLWQACVAKAGFKGDPERLRLVGVDDDAVDKGEVREDDVKRAVVDVACKDETHLVQRLGDLDANAQAPVIKRYQAELEQSRAKLDEVHDHAVNVLKEAGL